jgi:catechol 2,3-dioxygenase-like lactoylglutathione lyase family enzyme
MTRVHGAGSPADVGLPTSRGIEHLNMTVGDLDEVTEFFVNVLGCRTLYTMGPFESSKDPFMRIYANADVRSVVHQVRVLRSPFLNIELFEVSTPRQRPVWPDLLDIGGWGLTAHVDDIDAAIGYLDDKDVYLLDPGKTETTGPEAGEGAFGCRFMTRFGLHFELVSFPSSKADNTEEIGGLWNPAAFDGDAAAAVPKPPGGLPGFRGFERIRITVADLDRACLVFEDVLGFERRYDLAFPAADHDVPFRAYANADARAQPTRARVLRSPYLNVELVECPPYPGQNALWPAMFDVGGWHLALYVDDVDAAYAHVERFDVHLLGPKKPAYHYEAGDDAFTVHCLAPFGLCFELVTYPHGRYREDEHAGRAWHPGHPAR